MEIRLQVAGSGMGCNRIVSKTDRIAYLFIVCVEYLIVRLIFADIEKNIIH